MPTIIPKETHNITYDQLNPHALSIAKTLVDAGFEAYLVGGCIRDLLLQQTPKDFDIATSAHPEEVESLFKRCRLIGRRFRLAHVSVGKEVIEVATFRASPESSKNQSPTEHHQIAETGLVIRDNCYGNIEEDALRRDFTINALYLDPETLDIRDYVDAMSDIKSKTIRLIGEPDTRFREDPVRVLRAIRFKAKLNFQLDDNIEATIKTYLPLLQDIAPARKFEELLKLLLTGHAKTSFEILNHYQTIPYLLPCTQGHLEDDISKKLFHQALVNTDTRIATGKHVTPAFLLSVFLWPELRQVQQTYMQQQIPPTPALHKAASDVLDRQITFTSIPRRFTTAMREIWELQNRLPICTLKRCESLVQQRRFRAGYDFLLLREECGEIEAGLGEWWTQYQEANTKTRKQLIDTRRKKSRRKKPNP